MNKTALLIGWLEGWLAGVPGVSAGTTGFAPPAAMDAALAQDWRARWERNILADAHNRYCDREMGEELGWLVSPFLNGFYYGYLATGDTAWIDRLADWAGAVIRRAVREPDGYPGWPKAAGASTSAVEDFTTDNQLGEAMLLRPLVLMAGKIRQTPALKLQYGQLAQEYLALAGQIFEKWDRRGAWRKVPEGGVWVVPLFGLEPRTGQWTAGYARRATDGFTLPANKQNLIAAWLLALHDATGQRVYRDRAEDWWRVMKSRLRLTQDRRFVAWNYWDPAGPWDRKPDGAPKHWVGVHPNGGYYAIDVEGMVLAFEHGLVFTRADVDRLIATNRDFMWNRQLRGAKFGRLDGGAPDARWANAPGVLWSALAPYDPTLRRVFEANHQPDNWGGLSSTPAWLARCAAPPR